MKHVEMDTYFQNVDSTTLLYGIFDLTTKQTELDGLFRTFLRNSQ